MHISMIIKIHTAIELGPKRFAERCMRGKSANIMRNEAMETQKMRFVPYILCNLGKRKICTEPDTIPEAAKMMPIRNGVKFSPPAEIGTYVQKI